MSPHDDANRAQISLLLDLLSAPVPTQSAQDQREPRRVTRDQDQLPHASEMDVQGR